MYHPACQGTLLERKWEEEAAAYPLHPAAQLGPPKQEPCIPDVHASVTQLSTLVFQVHSPAVPPPPPPVGA